ncbi:MAG: uracil-DNA glycosylase [Oscillospiraceae bacterium]|nr:uracil-DNA glycosylase [Oscillospiraceae bacterium]
MTLQDIDNRVKGCIACDLCKTRTNTVFGTGNPNASIMFVGEAPGRNEDETGIPFVGAAGHLLDDYLTAVGLSREDVYIANIIKCRPPNNRDPRPDEEDCCIHFLHEQIDLINPKLIVCLGRIAAKRLIDPNFQVTRQHGEIYSYQGRKIMATFHPAALLRNPANKVPTFTDFEKIYEIAKQENYL